MLQHQMFADYCFSFPPASRTLLLLVLLVLPLNLTARRCPEACRTYRLVVVRARIRRACGGQQAQCRATLRRMRRGQGKQTFHHKAVPPRCPPQALFYPHFAPSWVHLQSSSTGKTRLKRLLEIILKIGNHMNGGTSRGGLCVVHFLLHFLFYDSLSHLCTHRCK